MWFRQPVLLLKSSRNAQLVWREDRQKSLLLKLRLSVFSWNTLMISSQDAASKTEFPFFIVPPFVALGSVYLFQSPSLQVTSVFTHKPMGQSLSCFPAIIYSVIGWDEMVDWLLKDLSSYCSPVALPDPWSDNRVCECIYLHVTFSVNGQQRFSKIYWNWVTHHSPPQRSLTFSCSFSFTYSTQPCI